MSIISHERTGEDTFSFIFGCDFPHCDKEITLTGKSYEEDDDLEDIAFDAMYHEAKHGEWGPRSVHGFYCEDHEDLIRQIRKMHYNLLEASKLEDEADKIRFRLKEKGVYEDHIEEVEKFEGFMD